MAALTLAGLGAFASLAGAQTVAVPAAADTYLGQLLANLNHGQENVLLVQQLGRQRALVRMDQAAIASAVGSGSLVSATLELYATSSGNWSSSGRTVDLHRLNAAWTETGATWSCPNDTIPINLLPNCPTQWSGGTFEEEASDSVLHTNATSGYVRFNVTEDVRSFLAGTSNFGWLVKLADETAGGNVGYASREGLSTRRPRLVLVVESATFDQVPPSLAITSPSHAVLVNETAPQIGLSYGDGGSGVALSSLTVRVDGVAASCTAGAAAATCVPAPLAEGSHTITASLRDQAGNEATASRSFTLLVGPGRRSAAFPAVGDTYLRQGEPNQSFGGEPILRVRQSGRNRSLVRFDAAEIARVVGTGTLVAARLELAIARNGRNWNLAGRMVDAHRLTADWTEAGATWNCATDTNLSNLLPNCSPQWSGGTFQAAATASVLHTNDLSGTVSFDVTADVASLLGGTPGHGWLIKKREELYSGLVEYASREAGAATAPRLVLVFDLPPGSSDTTAPTISITAPPETVFNDVTPAVRLEYADTDSGVALDSLRVLLDGTLLAGCVVGGTVATCEPPELSPGDHEIKAEISDRAGNVASAEKRFRIAADSHPPSLNVVVPVEGLLYNQPRPVLEVSLFDLESGIDTTSFSIELDSSSVSSGCTFEERLVRCVLGADLAPGEHTIHAEVGDIAGNHSQVEQSFTLVIDTEPPALTLAEPPAEDLIDGEVERLEIAYADTAAGIDVASFSATLDGVPLVNCGAGLSRASCSVSDLAEGSHLLTAEIRDLAGNIGQFETTLTVLSERGLPVLSIVSPPAGPVHGSRLPQVELTYSDSLSGVDPSTLVVTLDATNITVECTVRADGASCPARSLAPGAHTVTAEIADRKGNRRSARVEVELSLALEVAVTSPAQGTLIKGETVRLAGTVSPLATSVRVGDLEASVSGASWVLEAVPLREGSNALTAIARSPEGGVGTATVIVIRDTEAPRVAILSPPEGFITSMAQITIAGDLVDSASSAATQRPLSVRVNDQVPTLERKSFVLPSLLLVPGENRIEVTAEDAAGNVGRSEVMVRYVPDAAARIEEVSGNFQEALVRETLQEPLLVQLVDFLGRPLAGRAVEFAVTRGDGVVMSFPEAARRLSVLTDSAGLAQVQFALGTRAGAGNQEVTVSSVGIPGSIVFCASARTKSARQIQPIVGTDFQGARSGAAGQPLPKPLLVQLFDEFGNPVRGVEVTFRSIEGGGSFAGAAEVKVATDEEGKAGAIFTLGSNEGINNNVAEATFAGSEEHPARFVISGMVPGPAEATSISGVLLDPQDAPVPGARIHVGNNETSTDAEGKFRLTGVPVGTVHLGIDGATVTRPGVWPPLGYEMVTVSGRDNTLGKPLRLPQLDDAGKKWVGGNEDVVVPIHGVAGATLTVFANSATFPDGSREGWVSFTQVPSYKVPMVAPMNTNFQIAWSIQPAGVHFDPPARVSIPNFGADASGGNPPGMTVEIFSFDHDLEEFVSAGTASISEDGQRMVSNPGMGVSKTGWGGCPRPPSPPAGACSRGTPPEPCKLCSENGGPPVSQCTGCQVCTGEGCKPQTLEGVEIEVEEDPPSPGGTAESTAKAGTQLKRVSLNREAFFHARRIANAPQFCKAPVYTWDFGDDTTDTGEDVGHTYKKLGEYDVKLTLSCTGCDIGPIERNVRVRVEGEIKFDSGKALVSNQLPGIECNTLPPRISDIRAQSNIPMLVGATSGRRGSLLVHHQISHQEAVDVTFFGVRLQGGEEIVKSIKASGIKGPTKLEFDAEPGLEPYQVVAGFDENESGELEKDEILETYPDGFLVITSDDYDQAFAIMVTEQQTFFPAGGAAVELTDFFLGESGGAGSFPPSQVNVSFFNQADGLSHPTGASWSAACTASIPFVEYAPHHRESTEFALSSTFSRKAVQGFLIHHQVDLWDYLTRNPIAVGEIATIPVPTPGAWGYQAEVAAGDWHFLTDLNERDLFLAFGKVSVTGKVQEVRVRKYAANLYEVIAMLFDGSFFDTVDYNIKATLRGLPITKQAATLQAGHPPLGLAGKIFRDRLIFNQAFVTPNHFGFINFEGP